MIGDNNSGSGTGSGCDMELYLREALDGLQFKQGERNLFLGELRERVIRVLDIAQAKAKVLYPEIIEAINHPKANNLLIHHSVSVKEASRYEKPARQKGLKVTYVCDTGFKGSVGLVVAAEDAVDVEDIAVPVRSE